MIYADNAATTQLSDFVLEKMLPFLREQYGNASSQYSLGVKAKRAVEHARQQTATALGVKASEITFTSGGSEANSWVLRSVADSFRNEKIHIVTSAIEHHSIINACHALEQNEIEVSYIPVDENGVINPDSLRGAIQSNTKLVSIMYANNEIGTVQPIADIGKFLHERGVLFHTDAVQAVGHITIDVSKLNIDFLSASAHKFNGPKGTGFLYKRSGVDLPALVFGGEQEYGARAGTENVAGIVASGYALEESVANMQITAKKLQLMVNETLSLIKEKIQNVRVNGGATIQLPGILNLGFDDISGEALMNLLDLRGICVSTSSACSSGKNAPSHVLLALGQTEEQAKSAIRISYGRLNNEHEAEAVATAICDAYFKIKNAIESST